MAIGRIPEPGTGIPESIIAAKGDILTGTANDTPAVLTVGANGTTLVADSGETLGLKWATPAGGLTYADNSVVTDQSTSSGSYTDLATTQSVTLTTGTKALVMMGIEAYNSGQGYAKAAVAVSGASTVAASDDYSWSGGYSGLSYRYSSLYVYTGLTAGSNTFTLKFKATALTAYFSRRSLIVIDLGS
jgi:hypothetical protein